MKRILMLLTVLFMLAGCSGPEDESRPAAAVSQTDRERYGKLVDKTLYDTYWRYSKETLEFFQGVVPEQKEENAAIFAASADTGYLLASHAGKQAVTATVDLLHYNGDAAGRGYFYFIGGSLAGCYYSGGYKDDYHGLLERNLFLADGKFTKFDTGALDTGKFLSKTVAFPPDGFVTEALNKDDQLLLASIELGNVVIYRENNDFSRYRTLYLNSGDLEATSAALLPAGANDALAVLLSNLEDNESPPIDSERVPITSVKVVFYNESFQRNGEMLLASPNYTCVAADGASLVLFNGDSVEYYDYTENGYEKVLQYFLGHGVLSFKMTDLDNDGTMEYIMTDGLDLYLYHRTDSGFVKLWSTHLSVSSLSGNIYSGDLNQDGAKEIYVGDTTGTMIRYILTPGGLRSANKDVEYGDRIYPLNQREGSFTDYVRLNNVEGLQSTLYTADLAEGE